MMKRGVSKLKHQSLAGGHPVGCHSLYADALDDSHVEAGSYHFLHLITVCFSGFYTMQTGRPFRYCCETRLHKAGDNCNYYTLHVAFICIVFPAWHAYVSSELMQGCQWEELCSLLFGSIDFGRSVQKKNALPQHFSKPTFLMWSFLCFFLSFV